MKIEFIELFELSGRQLVNHMTNWQRKQWARAGYPGLVRSNYDPERIRPFSLKVRPQS
jgi:hypothetical protein